jgi:hypothetical protein
MICRWVELAGKKRALAGCAPPTYDEGLPTTVIRVGDVKLLALYAPNRSSLWLRFANGSVARIHPHNGVALYEVRQPGSFVYVEARGAGAKTTLRFPVSLRSS